MFNQYNGRPHYEQQNWLFKPICFKSDIQDLVPILPNHVNALFGLECETNEHRNPSSLRLPILPIDTEAFHGMMNRLTDNSF